MRFLFFPVALLLVLPVQAAQGPAETTSSTRPTIEARHEAVASGLGTELRSAARALGHGDKLRVRDVPLFDGPLAELELESFSVFKDGARIMVQGADGNRAVEPPDDRLFRGRVAGEDDSLAFVGVMEDGSLQGLVVLDDRIFLVGTEREDADGPLGVSSSATAPGAAPPLERRVSVQQLEDMEESLQELAFRCGNDDHPTPLDLRSFLPDQTGSVSGGLFRQESAMLATYAVDVALETDHEFYQRFGSTSGALSYINLLFGAIATIYERDVDTQLRVSHAQLYSTSADPWGTNPNTYLDDLMSYWQNNNQGIQRTLVHQLRGRTDGFGVAYVGVLCSQSFHYGLTTSIRGNYHPQQTVPVWDLVAVAHELGHNFSSPHTHCYNPPIDQCSTSGNGCYSGPTSVPSDGSTIMSYCHLRSGGMNNINTYLGRAGFYGNQSERVNQQILNHLAWAQGNQCLPAVVPPTPIFADNFESGSTSAWGTTP